MAKTIVALFEDFDDAQRAVQDLVNSNFSRDDISLVASNEGDRYMPAAGAGGAGTETASGAAGGAGIGAVLGGLAGLLVGLGVLAIPGIGPILAAGPLAATLAGAGIGAVTGGLIGALVDAGVPEEEARYYAEGVRRGGVLVTVQTTDEMVQQAQDILNRHNPVDIHRRATQWQETGWTGEGAATTAMPYGTTETGNFADYDSDFRRNYESTYANMGYSYDQYRPAYRYGYDLGQNERYRDRDWTQVEADARRDWEQRYPNQNWGEFGSAVRYGWERSRFGTGQTSGYVASSYPPETERDIRRESGDFLRSSTDSDQYSGTDMDRTGSNYGSPDASRTGSDDIRRAQGQSGTMTTGEGYAETDQSKPLYTGSDAGQAGSQYRGPENAGVGYTGESWTRGDISDYDTDYRRHYDTYYTSTGRTYDEYQPAYRYGYDIAQEDRYRGRNWNEIEPEVRRDWERRNPDSVWDDIKDAVRHAWQNIKTKS